MDDSCARWCGSTDQQLLMPGQAKAFVSPLVEVVLEASRPFYHS